MDELAKTCLEILLSPYPEQHDGSTITEIEAAVLRAEIYAAGKKGKKCRIPQ
jgi:hypothetical protein